MVQDRYQIVVIGAGSAGLVIATGAAKAGKKVLLIERGTYGGECTNSGCIPSKSFIASSQVAHAIKYAKDFGLEGVSGPTNTKKVLERVRQIISSVRKKEEPKFLKEKKIETVTATASFTAPHLIQIKTGEKIPYEVYGEKIVIATGSSALIPDIAGIYETPFLTNETLFALHRIPKSISILGGGPVGCEMAQAFSRLGSHVIQIHKNGSLLNKEEPEAQEILAKTLEKEGVELFLGFETKSVSYSEGKFTLIIKQSEKEETFISSDALFVAVGRKANTDSLQLKAAGIAFSEKGIQVDKYGRTSQKHIWAIGDVVEEGPKFTHAAENQARKVLLSLLSPIRKKLRDPLMPRVTFTDPEIACFGLSERAATELFGQNVAIYSVPFTENDRAITAGRKEGFVKVITKKRRGKILGATIVGPRAGEMLPELCLAAKENISLRKLSSLIHPYPTYNLAIRKSADLWLIQTFLPWLKHPFQTVTWKRFLPLFILLLLIAGIYLTGIHSYLTIDIVKERQADIRYFVDTHFVLASLSFVLIYIISTGLSLPIAGALSLIGGALFPMPLSTFYVVTGATLGSAILFFVARTAFGEILRRKAGPFLQKMEQGFKKNAWSYLLLLRFIPLFPFWLVNVAAAFFQVSFLTFLWTTFLGILPGSYVYTQVGAGIKVALDKANPFSFPAIFNKQFILSLLAIGLLAVASFIVKKVTKIRNPRC